MNKPENFSSTWSSLLPSAFLRALDRSLQALNRKTGPYAVDQDCTFTAEDEIDSLQVDATAGNLTITLPVSPTGNRRRRVIKTDSSANTVTVSGNGSLINGAATYVLATQYDKLDVEPTGTGWLIVN